jgi:hypothetical protein
MAKTLTIEGVLLLNGRVKSLIDDSFSFALL